MRSKSFIIILAVFLSVSFSACSQSNKKEEVTTGPIINSLKPITINFFFPTLFGVGDKSDTYLVFDEIEKKANVKLNIDWYKGNDYLNKVRQLIKSGENIDAFLCCQPQSYTFGFTDLFRAKEIKDITDLLPEYAPNLNKLYVKGQLKSTTVDGKLAALPSLYPKSRANYAIVRNDLLLKYKLPEIKTYDDYEIYLKCIKDNEMNIYPGKIFTGSLDLFAKAYDYAVLDSALYLVYKWDDPDMKIKAFEQTPEFKTSLNYLKRWYDKGYLLSGGTGYQEEWVQAKSMMTENKLASVITMAERDAAETIQELLFELNDTASRGTNSNIKFYAYLLYPEKKDQLISPAGNGWSTFSIVFNAKSDKTERLFMFLDWLYQDQANFDLFMYGIKGKHYELKGDQIQLPNGTSYANHPYIGWYGSSAFNSLTFERYPVYYSSAMRESHIDYINEDTTYAPHEGFYLYDFLSDEEKSRDYRDTPIFQKIELPLLQGTYNINNTDRIIEELRNLGADSLVSKIQTSIDKWRKK